MGSYTKTDVPHYIENPLWQEISVLNQTSKYFLIKFNKTDVEGDTNVGQ